MRNYQSLLQAAEIWVPAENPESLQLAAGSYGARTDFAAASMGTTCKRGEGLPGRVWATGSPIVLRDRFCDAQPARSAAVTATDLTIAVGMPVFDTESLRAVVVLIFGNATRNDGALEIWKPNPEGTALQLFGGEYGHNDDFRRLSALMAFPRGVGLPGIVWQQGAPHILRDLGCTGPFIRALAAKTLGFDQGLGIPIFRGGALDSVVVFISALGIPLSGAFEVWTPDPTGKRLECSAAAYHKLEAFEQLSRKTTVGPGEGLPGRVWSSGVPIVLEQLPPTDPLRAPAAYQAGLRMGIGIPILRGATTTAVVVLLD